MIDFTWWAIGTDKIKLRCATMPTKCANSFNLVTEYKQGIIPDEFSDLRLVLTHYSDDDTYLKTIVFKNCINTDISVDKRYPINDGITQTYVHTFVFSEYEILEV